MKRVLGYALAVGVLVGGIALGGTSAGIDLQSNSGCTTNCTFTNVTLGGQLDAGSIVTNQLDAGSIRAVTITSTAAQNANGFVCAVDGCVFCLNSACTDVIKDDAAGSMVIQAAGVNGLWSPTVAHSSKNSGTITLSSGTGTATVTNATKCVCTDTTATNVVKCAVSTTTLTATGTTTDVIAYLCF